MIHFRLFIYLCFGIYLASCSFSADRTSLVPLTVKENSYLPRVLVNVASRDRFIHVRTFGIPQKPVVFVLHGSYTDSRPYQNIGVRLSEDFFVVLWDQRGCGLSERIEEEEFTLDSAVDEINALKKIYAPDQKLRIIGQSWGGGLATLYTSRFPENVESLVLIEPLPLTGSDMEKLFDSIVKFDYFNSSWNNMARHGQAISFYSHEELDYRAMMILRSTMTSGYHCDPKNPPDWPIHRVGGFLEYVRNKRLGDSLSGFNYNFTEGLYKYEKKVMILGGSCSSLGYKMQLKYSKRYVRNSEIIEVRDAGHRMTLEKEEEVLDLIHSFLISD